VRRVCSWCVSPHELPLSLLLGAERKYRYMRLTAGTSGTLQTSAR
jgi:hypothetical protein